MNIIATLGLYGVTVIAKEAKEQNDRVLLGALLLGCIVSIVERDLCLGTYGKPATFAVDVTPTMSTAYDAYILWTSL